MSKNEQQPELKPVVTIGEMASMVGLSRTRFNDLVRSGFFLMPLYSISSRRPFYNADQQLQNLEARENQIGLNGDFVMFYAKRTKTSRKPTTKSQTSQKRNEFISILERLKSLGVHTNATQVEEAISELFPQGIKGESESTVLRSVMRYLRHPSTPKFINT